MWVAIELTSAALVTGIVTLSSNIRALVAGRHAIRTEDGELFGTLTVSERGAWGLINLFRRRGGEPGDVLVLMFNHATGEVMARIGLRTDVVPEPTLSATDAETV